jgi:hypothetical protein
MKVGDIVTYELNENAIFRSPFEKKLGIILKIKKVRYGLEYSIMWWPTNKILIYSDFTGTFPIKKIDGKLK